MSDKETGMWMFVALCASCAFGFAAYWIARAWVDVTAIKYENRHSLENAEEGDE